MRITYSTSTTKNYWEKRWSSIDLDSEEINDQVYPLKYANLVVKSTDQYILEAGCGTGRVMKHFHAHGFKIKGIDYIASVVDRLKQEDNFLDVEAADITDLKYKDNTFDVILAFGLYHGLEGETLNKSFQETHRVLRKDGLLCASFRADNVQNYLSDFLKDRRSSKIPKEKMKFHKMNLTAEEYQTILKKNGFEILKLYPVENMPLLYKFRFFRHAEHKTFNENKGRSEGYKLSPVGNILQKSLMTVLPNQFCNLYVAIAKKV